MRARIWISVLVGAILIGSATFFLGLFRFQNGWYELTLQEFAIWLIVIGSAMGALIGFLVARVTLLSVKRRTRFLILGALCGTVAGLVYGFSLEELCDTGVCNIGAFFGWHLPYVAAVAAWTAIGAIGGSMLGLAAHHVRPGRPGHVTPSSA